MKREYIDPIETIDENNPVFEKKIEHPAYAVIGASRVSGQMKLFDSDIEHHNGYVMLRIGPAKVDVAGGHRHIHGGINKYIEVAMTESQWVGLVSRMNISDGVPCTLTNRVDSDGTYHQIPGIAQEPTGAMKLEEQEREFLRRNALHIKQALAKFREVAGTLPAKKQKELEDSILHIANYAESNLEFYKASLGETSEKLVSSAKVEIEAMVSAAVGKLGLASTRQLGQLLAADPQALVKALSHDPPQVMLQIPNDGESNG